MNIPKFAIDNYQTTILAFLCFLFLGVNTFNNMPRAENPHVEGNGVFVNIIYPGASPEEIESQIVDELEEEYMEIDEIKNMFSRSFNNGAGIEIEFESGSDPKDNLDEILRTNDALASDFPDEVLIKARQFSLEMVSVLQVALVSNVADFDELNDYAELMERQIEKVKGITNIEITGVPEKIVEIGLEPDKMSQMGIGLQDIENAIISTNANIPGGSIKLSEKLFNVKTSGRYEDINQIRNTIVGSYGGNLVYLKNVADVGWNFKENKWITRYNGHRCIFLSCGLKSKNDVLSVIPKVRAEIDDIELPSYVEKEYVFDQSDDVKKGLNIFMNSLISGIILVGIIIFLILGYRSAGLVILAIPLSILIGLWFISLFGKNFEQMSIAGLVVALGLLVDNSIVVVENIERFLNMGYSRKESALRATNQIIAPVTSATLTTMLAFVPLIMLPDEAGEFMQSLPLTVVGTLTGSYLIAITLTPLVATWILKPQVKEAKVRTQSLPMRLAQKFIQGPYSTFLRLIIKFRWIAIALTGLVLYVTYLVSQQVEVTYFPKSDKAYFKIIVSLPDDQNINATNNAVKYVERALDTIPDISRYTTNVGHGNVQIFYNDVDGAYKDNKGYVFVVLDEYRAEEQFALVKKLRGYFDDYPYAEITVKEYVQGPPGEGGKIALNILGPDIEKLGEYASQLEEIMESEPGTFNIKNPLSATVTDLYFDINKDKALLFGVPIFQIDKNIRTFLTGMEIAKFKDVDAEEYEIVAKMNRDKDFSMEDFSKIKVKSMSGGFIPIHQFSNIEFKEAPSLISHYNNQRSVMVTSDLEEGYDLESAVTNILDEFESIDLEKGYFYDVWGELAERDETFGGMGVASGIAMLLILVVLVIQFKSFTQPLIVFSALPLALIGTFFSLYLFNVPFSFTGFVGLISLIGIAINNSIVLVDFANKAILEGYTLLEGVVKAAQVRFLPIVMTTLTTILGILPLTLTKSPMWQPMGTVIIGGLISSTIFILLLVPALYFIFTSKSRVKTDDQLATANAEQQEITTSLE